jgi:hypothetical protein
MDKGKGARIVRASNLISRREGEGEGGKERIALSLWLAFSRRFDGGQRAEFLEVAKRGRRRFGG